MVGAMKRGDQHGRTHSPAWVLDAIQPTQYAIPLKTGVFNARLFVRLMMLEESEKNDDRNRHA
jgi:hypothetical protein